jgi:hypothetical protein
MGLMTGVSEHVPKTTLNCTWDTKAELQLAVVKQAGGLPQGSRSPAYGTEGGKGKRRPKREGIGRQQSRRGGINVRI